MSALGITTAIVRVVSRLVPAESRDEWVEEWCGELAWEHDDLLQQGEHEITILVALCTRLSGLLPDSLALRFADADHWPADAGHAIVELAHAPVRSTLGIVLLSVAMGLAAPVLLMSPAMLALLGSRLGTGLALAIFGAPALLCGLGLPSAAVQVWRVLAPPPAGEPRHALAMRAAVVATAALLGASMLASAVVGHLASVTFPGDATPLLAGLHGAGGRLRLFIALAALGGLQFALLLRPKPRA